MFLDALLRGSVEGGWMEGEARARRSHLRLLDGGWVKVGALGELNPAFQ